MGGKETPKILRPIVWFLKKIIIVLDFVCSYLEMHLVKIVSFSIMALCCFMVNALHMGVVIMLLLCLLFGISALRVSFFFIGPFLSLLFLAKMLYQTNFIPEIRRNVTCLSKNATFSATLQLTIVDPEWWGFSTLNSGEKFAAYYKGYVLVFLVLTFQTVISTRQKISRIDAGESPDIPHVLFINITRKDADKSFVSCVKYLINYGFYKFGIEITLSFCVFDIAYRVDVFSVLYAVWIVILVLPDRLTLSMIWPFFLTTIIFSILWQYTMAVGLSPHTCFRYPWTDEPMLAVWMFLPSFSLRPNTKKTLVDFVLLLLIQRQLSVFELERKYGDRYFGGSNKGIYNNREVINNPTPDHTGNIRSWLDVVKFLFMRCLFRITLAFVFWNGASNANILSLGYLVGAFVFLWIDCDLCLWPIKKILKWWNSLLGYTVFVIVFKSVLEFAGCIYYTFLHKNAHPLVELLYLHCSSPPLPSNKCPVKSSSSFYWDVVCFTLIIFQRRYFQSYYFLHEVDDVLAVTRLQHKGAKLMDELQENKLKNFQLSESKTLNKIKKNMNRIKNWQKRMHGLNYNEPTDHAFAIYSGDYFMFENLDGKTVHLEESSSSSEDFGREGGPTSKNLTMTEFIGTVFKRAGEESSATWLGKKKESDGLGVGDQDDKQDKWKKETVTQPGVSDKKKDEKRIEEEKETGVVDGVREDVEEKDKMKKSWRLFRSFLDSAMVSMIQFFNKNSRDYRYIESKMKAERKLQKKLRREASREQSEGGSRNSRQMNRSSITIDGRRLSLKSQDSRDETDDPTTKKSSQTLLVSLINSICMFIMSQTELLCYLIIFLHTVLSPTLLSLPLPFFVFMWGSLTTIRPTTTFWTVLIAYTEVTVVIKALFQNSIFPWNVNERYTLRPEYPPLFLGIHRDNQFVVADLFLLLLLFLHRYKLKSLGLWNRTHEEDTILPENLQVYRELPSEKDFKDVKGNRSLVHQRKMILNSEPTDSKESVSRFIQMATWKCTSRVTAKLHYWKDKIRTRIRIKEIEGPILVTHEGRRLEPTLMYVNQVPDESLEGNVVLRVYVNEVTTEARSLIYKLTWAQHFTSLRKFFIQIVVRDWRVSADFYTLMFIFEFLDFLIVFFGYTSFTEADIVTEDKFSLAESQIPFMYLFTMISHFMVIIVDRVLYLRKSVIGKLVLQFILVILVHVWMFIIIPIFTESPFNKLYVPQTYYMISCLYFLMSAYQLRVGYPMRVQGHFLCKKYGYLNWYAFKCLQFIPFFNQLRILLDFLCTKSSMTMSEWVKMESMFQLVFENKCSRRADIHYPVPRGIECPKCDKYTPGVFVLLGLIIVIWMPFIVFALFNTVAQPNLPQEASLSLQIGNFGKIYITEASFTDIITLTEGQYKSLQSLYKDNRKIWSFLSLFDSRDVAVLRFKFEPNRPWIVTAQELTMLNETVQNLDNPITLYLIWSYQRIPRSQIVASAKGHKEIVLNRTTEARKQLADAFVDYNTTVQLNHFLPKFIHITNEGVAKKVSGFLGSSRSLRNVSISLQGDANHLWWRMVELDDDPEERERIHKLPFQTSKEITIYTFNEKNIPKLLLNISKKGILGLYLSIVLVMWTIVRRAMWRYPYLMFTEMPNPDPVLKLCHDIYLARESQEFALEEDLYAKLLFLFRSPETMIKVTRLTTFNPPR